MTGPDGGTTSDLAGLAREAFGTASDPETLFVHAGFQRVCADLLVARLSERRGLFLITGEPGTGKSTLLAKICAERRGGRGISYLSCRGAPSFDRLVAWWCDSLGLGNDADNTGRQLETLFEHLMECQETGGTSTLLLDDAEHLEEETLEELCHLGQFEERGRPLLRTVLAARPELATRLAAAEHLIAFQSRLAPMGPFEVGSYIQHNLDRMGRRDPPVFSPDAIQRIAQVTRGNPRLINGLCHTALLTAARIGRATVSAVTVEQAIQEGAGDLAPDHATIQAPHDWGLAFSPAPEPPPTFDPDPSRHESEGVWPISIELDVEVPDEPAPSGQPDAANRLGAWAQSFRFAAGLMMGVVIGAAGVSFYKAYDGLRDNISFELLLSPRDGKLEAIAEADEPPAAELATGTAPPAPAARNADADAGSGAQQQAWDDPVTWLYELIGWPEPSTETKAQAIQGPESQSHR